MFSKALCLPGKDRKQISVPSMANWAQPLPNFGPPFSLSRTCCCSLKVVIGCLEAKGVHTWVFWFKLFFPQGFIYSSLKDPNKKQNTNTNCDNISKVTRGHIRSICCVWCSPGYDLKSGGDATRNPEKKHSTTRTPGHNKRDNPGRLQTNRSFLSSGLTALSLKTASVFGAVFWNRF